MTALEKALITALQDIEEASELETSRIMARVRRLAVIALAEAKTELEKRS